jgi:hypothetical protein
VLCTLGGAPGVALAQGAPGVGPTQSSAPLAQGTQGTQRTQRTQGTQGKHHNELIPLYDNANPSDWSTACSEVDGSGDGSWIIADPVSSGPGTAPIPAWTSAIDNCYAYGRASVIGYVWTDYGEGGAAGIPAIENEIKSWYSFYHGDIAGIFLDGVSDTVPGTSTSNQSFYQTLASYVHQNEGKNNNDEVVFNFGANPGSDWMLKASNAKNADIVVTFEGSYDTPGEDPYTAWTQAAWERRYPAEDFAALVYNTTSFGLPPQPEAVCNSLAQQNIGYVYVGTWYEFLAPYFSSFVSDC